MSRIVLTHDRKGAEACCFARRALAAMVLAGTFVCAGCGGFFDKKSTEIEAMRVLQELREVRKPPQVNNPLPDLYLQPPSRLEIKDGVKVFYFTRHHPAAELAKLVREQLDVPSHPHGPTNQIVAYCKDHKQADQVLLYLEKIDVPPVQVNVDCLILERFGDITMDWETSIFIENFLGEEITLGEKLTTFYYGSSGGKHYGIQNGSIFEISQSDYPGFSLSSLSQGALLDLKSAFPGASLRETERANFGADFGYWLDQHVPGHQVRTVIDVLISRGYLKILLNPSLETVNGQSATVTIQDFTPVEKVKTGLGGASDAYNITEYVWVKDTLTVTPMVYSDGSIGLSTEIHIGSRSKPEGVIQRSIITERSIKVEENRIRPGESLIIGGMRKSEKRSVIRGVPFFKDLPLLGILFSSKDFEEKGTEIIFIMTPSISSGGREHGEIVEEIQRKHEKPQFESGLGKMLYEPFGDSSYTEVVEKQAAETEVARIRAEADREEALKRLEEERQKAVAAREEAQRIRQEAQRLQKDAEQAQLQAKKALEAATAAEQQRQADQKRVQELSEQAKKALEEAQQAEAQARQAHDQAASAQQQAQQQAERVKQAAERAQQAQKELEKAKEQAESVPERPSEESVPDEPEPVVPEEGSETPQD